MISLVAIEKHYELAEQIVPVLRGIDLSILRGEFVSIMGASGAGKSTLMNIIGCLDRPTKGRYRLNERDIENMSEDDLAHVRNQEIGFVFQLFNLIPKLSALRNVELPLVYAGVSTRDRQVLAMKALARVGLEDRAQHTPAQLSGGQSQRVAIARALVNQPSLLVLDEPTGSLDSETSERVMHMLLDIHADGTTMVMVTHDADIATYSSRVITMTDGCIANDVNTQRTPG